MKHICHWLTLTVFITGLPILAEDKFESPGDTNGTRSDPPIKGPSTLPVPADPELMLMQIDLKVLLHHYERLRTEFHEAEMQMGLVNAEVNLNSDATDARKALVEKENDKTATKEDLDAARARFMRSKMQEMEKLNARSNALRRMADETREQAREVGKQMSRRLQESTTAQPQP